MTATVRTMTKPFAALDEGFPLLEFMPKEFDRHTCDRCGKCGFADADCCCELRERVTPRAEMTQAEMTEMTRSAHIDSIVHRDYGVWAMVRDGLAKAGRRLENVKCTVDETTLCLTGTVHRYFHLQMATEIARRSAAGRRIDLQIAVISKPDDPSLDSDIV